MSRSRVLLAALVLGLSATAWADVIKLKDGSVLEGTIVEREGRMVVVLRKGVEVVVDRDQVVSIERVAGLREELDKRRSALVPGDPEVRYALARWCREAGLQTERRELLEEVLRLAPDHADARAELGFVRDGDKWVLESDLKRRLGLEKVGGRWIPAEEAKRLRRQDELRRLFVAAALKLAKPDQAAAVRAELEALGDPPDVIGPILEERLGENDADVRVVFVGLLAKTRRKESAPLLSRLAFQDESPAVRASAARGVWASDDVTTKTELVQSLFHKSPQRRERAAEALEVIGDPETVPYLIEALEVVVAKREDQADLDASVVRDDGSAIGLRGRFGPVNEPRASTVAVGRTSEGYVLVAVTQRSVLVALQKITGRDFSYSKPDWHAWWKREGKAKLLAGQKP